MNLVQGSIILNSVPVQYSLSLITLSSQLYVYFVPAQKWMLQNMLGFMKKTKHIRHKSNEGTEGIYLSDLNSDDPEMAALYLPKAYRQNNVNGNFSP